VLQEKVNREIMMFVKSKLAQFDNVCIQSKVGASASQNPAAVED